MSIILSHFSNSSQQLSPTQEGHVASLVHALLSEEQETARINRLTDPLSRRCAELERTYFSRLDDRAFLDFRIFGRMTPRTVIRSAYLAFQLGYIIIQDTRRQANPLLPEKEVNGQVAERFHQWSLSRRVPRQVTGFRLILTEKGRAFGQTLRAALEVPDE